ncbi:hypothetical protein dsx2_0542 [Desulfovibrio sp. X2]|uniref:hypothetical protein n=1 Tax=Desulfovibrio sp. X2 TaxID=941449 RepID=UPI000358767F|nr:hypothetical protein [Desulfovibrio sp. X2]EPR38733.1 hypothetical protein dsx2_0542 [Desulfovibrio sp. X2]
MTTTSFSLPSPETLAATFSPEALSGLFPAARADSFFEAMFGDASEGAYDISLVFAGAGSGELRFEFRLHQRPGHCLRCSLTYGLPQVFARHPVLDVKGLAAELAAMACGDSTSVSFELDATQTLAPDLHVIPLTVRCAGA